MKKTFTLLLLFLLVAGGDLSAQQDPQYSQYMFNPLAINPAWAGSREMMNGALLMRRQWVGIEGAPKTNVFALSAPTRKGKVGWGLEINTDQIGPKRSSAFYLSYAYRVRIGKGKLAFGLGAGVVNYKINWNEIDYRDENDVFASLSSKNYTVPDVKFGMYYNTKRFYIGLSTTHINTQTIELVTTASGTYFTRFRQHAFLTFGRAFELNENVLFSPSVMVRTLPGSSNTTVDLNLNFQIRKSIWAGMSLRSERTVVAMIQYNAGQLLRIGYSYDLALGRLQRVQSGSHELMLGFNLDIFKSETLSPRYF
jgi:type IX secretion system PorP/SprF family membrane protein